MFSWSQIKTHTFAMFSIYFFLLFFFDHGMSLKPGQLNSAEIQTVLNAHNHYRRLQKSSNMNMLKWNHTLAEMAYNYLQKCLSEHGQPANPKSPFLATGQNIYAISPWRESNYSYAIQKWYAEIKYYNYKQNKCSDMCGHYTQVIWADSIFIGCASTNCTVMFPQEWKNTTMILCNYGPAGNYPDMRPYEPGESCEMCPLDNECIDGLCDADY